MGRGGRLAANRGGELKHAQRAGRSACRRPATLHAEPPLGPEAIGSSPRSARSAQPCAGPVHDAGIRSAAVGDLDSPGGRAAPREHLTARAPARPGPSASPSPSTPAYTPAAQDAIEQARVPRRAGPAHRPAPGPGRPGRGACAYVSAAWREHEPRDLEPETRSPRRRAPGGSDGLPAARRSAPARSRRLGHPPSPIRELDRRVVDRRETRRRAAWRAHAGDRRSPAVGLALGREHNLAVERDRRDGQAPVRGREPSG